MRAVRIPHRCALARLAHVARAPKMRSMQSAMPLWRHLCGALLFSAATVSGAGGQSSIITPDTRPYDERLMRLSEILGAVHYLRELCGANDGQAWRERMKELMDAEGSTALRRAKLTRSFNNGYRSYSRTYNSCTPTAQVAISRFLTEGAEIADTLMKSVP
jgi:uncharacterized protein (TIGR02301 family)